MYSSFFKITLRTIYREKLYAMINISGLALAIVCCVILGLYLQSQFTYDRHHERHKEIFRVVTTSTTNGVPIEFAVSSQVLGPMYADDFPEIKDFVRFRLNGDLLVRYGEKAFYWEDVYYTDDNIFDVFTHEIIYGDPKTALVEPNSTAVSRTFSERYFGNENPLGKVINIDGWDPRTITLVFEDLPENTHLKYDVLFSSNHSTVADPDNLARRRQLLRWLSYYTYLVLPEDYNAEKFNKLAGDFHARHMEETGKTFNNVTRHWIQPLSEIHLNSDLTADRPTGNKLYLYGFSAVALFILVVACINYMNLATARSARRSREAGMRKILGIDRISLIIEFLSESIIFSLISLVFAIVLLELVLELTSINNLFDNHLVFDLFENPALVGWMLGFSLLVGILSGLFPAVYLSSVAPLSALAGGNRSSRAGIRFREWLVLIQFAISVGVIACTILMSFQMRYITEKSIGYNKENQIVITLNGLEVIEKIQVIENELLKNSNVLGITASNTIMGSGNAINGGRIDNNDGVLEQISLNHMLVDDNFIEVMGMQLVKGRSFSKKLLTDIGSNYVVNEKLVQRMGWDEPLGKRILIGNNNGRVIGVVRDFHFQSLHHVVEPFAMHPFMDNFESVPANQRPLLRRLLIVNIAGDNIRDTLSYIQDKFAELDPRHPFEFKFLDDSLDQLYQSENRLMQLTGIFAGICIFIACLGLFGLTSFTTEQRTREIGIRKVIGSSSMQIITLLSRDILYIVLAGAVIASLLSYYAMDEWLSGFAYHTDINPFVFLVSALLAAVVAFITLALQTYKTARANPIEALRYE